MCIAKRFGTAGCERESVGLLKGDFCMFKRFLVSVAIAIFSCGTMWAQEGHTWYVLDPYQIDTFLVGVGGKQLNTKVLWENVKAHDVATEIGQKVKDFFVDLAKNTKETVAKDAPLRLMFEGLGFVSYKHDDKVYNVLLRDKYTFLNAFKDPEKHAYAEDISPGENGFLCADLYRSVGKLIADYFIQTLERVKIHEECAFEHPVIHILVKKLKDGKIKMRALPLGKQDIYEGHDEALSAILDAQKEGSWLSRIGKGALCFLGLCGLSEAAWNRLPKIVQEKAIKCMKTGCSKLPNSRMVNACNSALPTIEVEVPVSLPDSCQNPSSSAVAASCKALEETKKLSDERDGFEARMKLKLKEGEAVIAKLEKQVKEYPALIQEYKLQMQAKDNNITIYKNEAIKLNKDYKELNVTLIDCQKGLSACKEELKNMTGSSGNCTMREQIAIQKIKDLSDKLKISKEGMVLLKKGINAFNEELAEHVPLTNVDCKKNGTVLCDLIHLRNDLGAKTIKLLGDIDLLAGAIGNLE